MKKCFLPLTLLLLPFCVHTQYLNFDFANTFTGPCPFNPDVEITQTADWLVYQTLTGTWDGPIDSSRCFEVVDLDWKISLALDQADPDRTLFFRYLFNGEPLIKNHLYSLSGSLRFPEGIALDNGADCENGICSGFMMAIEIPDEAGTGTDLRWHTADFANVNNIWYNSELCLATEKFEENLLKELIIKVTFDEDDISQKSLEATGGFFEEIFNYFFSTVEEVTAGPEFFDNGEYSLNISQVADDPWIATFLFPYLAGTYPSPANISYVEARPEPNSPEKQTINLFVDQYQSVIFQPFTQLRGAFVEGDTIRHTLNLINEGGDFCYLYIELIFEDDVHFIYGSGNVGFGSNKACMMFRRGGSLQVMDGSKFRYGDGGVGVMALSPSGKIVLGENSQLFIDNRLLLIEDKQYPAAEYQLALDAGSALIFGENAALEQSPFATVPLRLNVCMNGGVLDDSRLSVGERALINRIYPPLATDFGDNVHVYPNPGNGKFRVNINLPEAQEAGYQIIDLHGNYISAGKRQLQKGINEWEVHEELLPGVYYLQIRSGNERTVKSFVVYD